MLCNHVTRLAGLKKKVHRTKPILKKSERKTYEEKFPKFLRKDVFGLIPVYLNGVESAYLYRDSIFGTCTNIGK
jgi:hypothetical protein